MRFLTPGRLAQLGSGLWAVDRLQPVAAVLDPHDGAVRRVVSWPDLPPPAVEARSRRTVLDDGTSLWVQEESGGPVARVTTGGTAATGLVDGSDDPSVRQSLALCRNGVAWCASTATGYEVLDRDAPPFEPTRRGQLQRVDADGRVHTVVLDRGVREVRESPQGLLVAAVGDDVHRRPRWDGDRDRVGHGTRWYLLPWHVSPPFSLTERFALPAGFQPPARDAPASLVTQSVAGYGPVARSGGLEWFARPSPPPSGGDRSWTRPVVTAQRHDGSEVASWDLGGGWLDAVTARGTRLTVAFARRSAASTSPVVRHPTEVLALDASDGSRTQLMAAESVDIGDQGWPLGPEPENVTFYAWKVLRAAQRGSAELERVGAREVEYRLDGAWPRTVLELTFTVSERPGVRLRQRVPLFDELGRGIASQHAAARLADRLAAGWSPPSDGDRSGTVDV